MNVFYHLDDVRREFNKNSDRGVAVVAASFLDGILQEILQAFFIKDIKNDKEMFDGNGPLSTFSAKINLCYRLGLISHFEYSAIDTIRSIRNVFAHNLGDVSFQEESIRDKCNNIRIPDNLFNPSIIPPPNKSGVISPLKIIRATPNASREIFQETIIQLMHMLAGRFAEAASQSRVVAKDYKKATEPLRIMVDYYKQLKLKFDKLRHEFASRGEAVEDLENSKQVDLVIRLTEYSISIIDAAHTK